MGQFMTLATLVELGELRIFLDSTRARDHQAQEHMTQEFDRYASRRGANHWTRRRGHNGPTTKLTFVQAEEVRAAYARHVRVVDIASGLGVTASTIYGILNGRTHKRPPAAHQAPAQPRPSSVPPSGAPSL